MTRDGAALPNESRQKIGSKMLETHHEALVPGVTLGGNTKVNRYTEVGC
jgi:hypothetical protein